MNIQSPELVSLTAEIVAAHVSHNAVPTHALPELIQTVHGALSGLTNVPVAGAERQPPMIAPEESVEDGYLVCLEDGKRLKMLRRHLMTRYGMTPEQYRAKWQLPHDYPMVAPAYAERRRNLAKEIGLGTPANRRRGEGGGDPA